MSKPPKIDRKSLKTPDSFVTRGNLALSSIFERREIILAVLGLVLVLVIGGYGLDWWLSQRVETAWSSYDEALKLPEKDRWDRLKTVVEKNGSVRPGYFAAVALGDHFFEEGKKDLAKAGSPATTSGASAQEWYQKALTFKDALPAEKQLLQINLGNALELQKKYDEAATAYKTASDTEGEAKGLALLNLGRAFELKGDSKQASATYEKVTTDFINSEYAKVAKNNLRRINSPLFRNVKL